MFENNNDCENKCFPRIPHGCFIVGPTGPTVPMTLSTHI